MSASIFTAASKGSTEPSGSRPRFEGTFWGNGGIERIHAEAGGWPHLVQLVAESVVDLLNDEEGNQRTSPLLERALDLAIDSGHNVFYELPRRESTLPGEWDYLSNFRSRETQPLPGDEAIERSLRRRLLLEEVFDRSIHLHRARRSESGKSCQRGLSIHCQASLG
jgi:hypothetical protein